MIDRYERMKKDVGMKFKRNNDVVEIVGVELNKSYYNGIDRIEHAYWISINKSGPIHLDYNRMQQILREVEE